MNTREVESRDRERLRKSSAKKAVALAMQNEWEDAVDANRAIIREFPEDLEAYNRLGKALSELGRNREAKEAFQRAVEVSPNNSIAKKNLERLARLGEGPVPTQPKGGVAPYKFIGESGKAGITSLTNLAPPDVVFKLAPGHPVQLNVTSGGLTALEMSGQYVGQIEPKLASRLIRLIKGGNQYEAAVTSVDECGLTIIIREVHKDPSQAGIVSFPLKGGDYRVYMPATLMGYELTEEEAGAIEQGELVTVKDWSDDDTEPGDDDAYTPVLHRIINPAEDAVDEDEGGF